MNETVTIGIDVYQKLIEAARDYQILVRTMLRTSTLNDYSGLTLNDRIVVEVMKSLGLNVEGTRENLMEKEKDE